MAEGTPAYYREKAAEAREHAQTLQDPDMKRQLLDVARTYERLAEYAERRPKPSGA